MMLSTPTFVINVRCNCMSSTLDGSVCQVGLQGQCIACTGPFIDYITFVNTGKPSFYTKLFLLLFFICNAVTYAFVISTVYNNR